jgi:hypothetical protein
MKLVKIKNLPNNQEIIKWLIDLLMDSESSYSPLINKTCYPTIEYYLIKDNDIIIPAYILYENKEALVLWVHKDYRKNGYAKFMVKSLGIKYAVAAPTSIPFWKKLGFKQMSNPYASGPAVMRYF